MTDAGGRPPQLLRSAVPWGAAVLAALVAACGGGEPTAPDPGGDGGDGAASVASVEVTPTSGELVALEATLELSAEALDADGDVMAGESFTWSSSDEAVLTVDADGVVTAVANGDATVEATTDGVSGEAVVTVRQVPDRVDVGPSRITLDAVGATEDFAVKSADANGHGVEGATYTWTSSAEAVATVDDAGVATARGAGEAKIVATADPGGVADTATLTVELDGAPSVSVQSPTDGATFEEGESITFQGSASDPEDGSLSGADLVWSSDVDGQLGTGVSVTRDDLSVGGHTISLTATDGDGNGATASADVTVEAAPPPQGDPSIGLSTTSASFEATEGESDPPFQTVDVSNVGDGTLDGLSAGVEYAAGGATGWLSASLSGSTAPATLTLDVSVGALAAGSYDATVRVASGAADNSPRTVDVTLTVTSALVAPELTGPGETTSPFTLTWTYDFTSCTPCPTQDGYRLEESTTSATSGFATIYDSFNQAERTSPKSLELDRTPGTYWYRVRAYDASGGGWTPYSGVLQVTVTEETRQVTIVNQMPKSLSIHEVVQVKVIPPNSTFGRADRLTDDPASCLSLPGESIEPGQSRSFEVTLGDDYWVFLGIGIWDLDNTGCPSSAPWFKRRFFTDTRFNLWYVWTEVHVSDHTGGDFEWTISGSYLDGTLAVTPAGGSPIPFNRTQQNPIP